MSGNTELTMGGDPCGPLRWYAVRIKGGWEDRARDGLVEQKYAVFLPKIEIERRHARKVEKVPRPLFPGYLFVSMGLSDRWRPIDNTRGCLGIIRIGDQPAPLPHRDMEDLRARCGAEQLLPLPKRRAYAVGTPLRIVAGPFADRVVQVAADDGDTIQVLFELLGRPVTVPITSKMVTSEGV